MLLSFLRPSVSPRERDSMGGSEQKRKEEEEESFFPLRMEEGELSRKRRRKCS